MRFSNWGWCAAVVLLAGVAHADSAIAVTPDAPVLPLSDVGQYRLGYVLRGQAPVELTPGATEIDDPLTGTTFRPAGVHNGQAAMFVHPPWRHGTGAAFQEYQFNLPAARRILLRGATALAEGTEKSDGVTFRVLVDGEKVVDQNHKQMAWQPLEADLTRWAGKVVTLRLETDPGPHDDSGWDHALWGACRLELEGFVPPARPAVPAPPVLEGLAAAVSVENKTAVAPAIWPAQITYRMDNNVAVLTCTNAEGTFAYRWAPPAADGAEGVPCLGDLSLHATYAGAPVEHAVGLARTAALAFTAGAQWQASRWEPAADHIALVSTYKVGAQSATLRMTGTLVGSALVLDVDCDQPVVTEFYGGRWGPLAIRHGVAVPYYGTVEYLPQDDLFANAYMDWTHSAAADLGGGRARYATLFNPPAGAPARNLLHDRVVFTAARHLVEVLPNIPNPPSPYRAALAGKIILDTWGGRFADIAAHLETLSSYGLDQMALIVHDWQRSGYDNALPQHFPANAALGGDAGMKALTATARRLGYPIALHENYVDYYPNYDGFNDADIARTATGERQLAWYNPGTKIQSFAEKPTVMLHFAGQQSPEIQRRYESTACFIDVCSAVPPWFHVDHNAAEDGAGTFRRVLAAHRDLWAWERQTHHGPVFGEGNNHFYWSGFLDGAEAQFGTGWPEGQGQTAPLAVDFDLLKIHPLQLNHGMGYYERWSGGAGWSSLPPMVVLDQYRMQEIAYGHAGFLNGNAWHTIPTAWVEHHLVAPVNARSATARVVAIAHQVAGQWTDATAAARAQQWQRVRVTYDNGLVITANAGVAALPDGTATLGQFGWSARGAGLTAYTGLRQGALVDYAATATTVFANARCAADFNYTQIKNIAAQLVDVSAPAPRTLRFTYQWHVGDALGADYAAFVHFLYPATARQKSKHSDSICFQQDHHPRTPTSQWQTGQIVTDGPFTITLPADLPDGDYPWVIGLWAPQLARVHFATGDQESDRLHVGTLHVREGGKTLTAECAALPPAANLALYNQHLNNPGQVIDFGDLHTDGSVLVRREGPAWVLYPFPRTRQFTLELRAARFGRPKTITAVQDAACTALAPRAAEGDFWVLPVSGSGQYRWPALP